MSQSNSSSGVSIVGLLGLLFIGLKLGHVIDWPWWCVLCPFWIGTAILLAVAVIALVFALVATILSGRS